MYDGLQLAQHKLPALPVPRGRASGLVASCKCSPRGIPTYTQVTIATHTDTHIHTHEHMHRAYLITRSRIRSCYNSQHPTVLAVGLHPFSGQTDQHLITPLQYKLPEKMKNCYIHTQRLFLQVLFWLDSQLIDTWRSRWSCNFPNCRGGSGAQQTTGRPYCKCRSL